MDFVQRRELVRSRYALRTLLAENRRDEARPLDGPRALAAADEEERRALEPELARGSAAAPPTGR